ncbi:MAG: DUF5675 family protein [Bacteroidota bacterium]
MNKITKALLIRLQDNGKQTIGELRVYNQHELVFSCFTLELPYRDNKRRVSCIPKGTYLVKKRRDRRSRFKYDHLHVQNVPGRSWILFHRGNYHHQIEGCVLVGKGLVDINRDGQLDVTSSKVTFVKLMKVLPEEFILEIV